MDGLLRDTKGPATCRLLLDLVNTAANAEDITGKLDRRHLQSVVDSLTSLELKSYTCQTKEHRPPRTDNETLLRELWSKVLQMPSDTISLSDSFFRFGGDSLSAMRLVAIARTTSCSITVADIFKCPDLESMFLSLHPIKHGTDGIV